jgi:hypothetical protein
MICGDLKVLCMLLGQQAGYTKYPSFRCEWDSRARSQHWQQKQWTQRISLEPGSKNILRKSLVDPNKIPLPSRHIKLGMIQQLVKALPKTGNCFKYLCKTFPHLSEAKLKEGFFVGPDIRKLMFDEDFLLTMTELERDAWIAFKRVVAKLLGNNKDPDYVTIFANMLEKFKVLGCLMSLKVHFLNSHLEFFPENLGAVNDEQGERFHQDLKELDRRSPGQWHVNMMGDYCWMLHREIPETSRKRKSNITQLRRQEKKTVQGQCIKFNL